jgi:hypothetical protein
MIMRIKSYSILIIKSLKSSSLTIKLSAINFHALINTSNDLSCLYNECLLDFNLLQISHSHTTVSTYFLILKK